MSVPHAQHPTPDTAVERPADQENLHTTPTRGLGANGDPRDPGPTKLQTKDNQDPIWQKAIQQLIITPEGLWPYLQWDPTQEKLQM